MSVAYRGLELLVGRVFWGMWCCGFVYFGVVGAFFADLRGISGVVDMKNSWVGDLRL